MPLRIAFDCDGVLADLDSALAEIAGRLFGQVPSTASGQADSPPGQGEHRDESMPAAALPAPPPPRPEAPRTDPGVPNGTERTDGADHPAGPAQARADEDLTAAEEQVEPERFRRLSRRQQHALWKAAHDTENFWETLPETQPGIVARLAAIAAERGWEVIFITQRPSSAGDTTQRQTQRWLARHGFDLPSVYVIQGSRGRVAAALSLDVVVDDRPENCIDVKTESSARAILVVNATPGLAASARRLGIDPVPTTSACLDLLTAAEPDRPGLMDRLKRIIGE